jgi:hypothetical protein
MKNYLVLNHENTKPHEKYISIQELLCQFVF